MVNFDMLTVLIDFEDGGCSKEEMIEGFEHLIELGVMGQMQGHYGRQAARLIKDGDLSPGAHRAPRKPPKEKS